MTKLPAFQFYPADWLKDPGINALDYFEQGVWIKLLCLMHESEEPGKLLLGGRPYPEDRLATALGLSGEVMGRVISTLITLNVASRDEVTGALMSRRMVRDRETVRKRVEWGKKGGNPAFVKGKKNPYYQKDNLDDNSEDNLTHNPENNGRLSHEITQKITPSSSSSDISSELRSGDKVATGRDPVAEERSPDAESRPPVERRIWNDGVDLLARSGLIESSARSFLGALAKAHGREALAEAIAATQAANPPDPKTYIAGIFKQRAESRAAMRVGKSDEAAADFKCETCCDLGHVREPDPNAEYSWQQIDVACPDCAGRDGPGLNAPEKTAKQERARNYGV